MLSCDLSISNSISIYDSFSDALEDIVTVLIPLSSLFFVARVLSISILLFHRIFTGALLPVTAMPINKLCSSKLVGSLSYYELISC